MTAAPALVIRYRVGDPIIMRRRPRGRPPEEEHMSYALPGQEPTPPARQRPGTVTWATWLLVLVGVLFALSLFIILPVIGDFTDAYREVNAGTDAEGTEGFQTAGMIGGAALNLLFGAGFIVLAAFNHRGANPSRIVTWVLGGLGLCCTGVGLAVGSLVANLDIDTGEGIDPAQMQRILEQHVPEWYFTTSTILTIVQIPALIAVLILLALPPSNRFFRKEPPAGPPGGVPGYPPPASG